ncbi:Uncharacterised protein [Salmonella enterica subsp. enterica serovar Pullorum]|nr:Uncharacterised protein [Salmonella enterica subsp. enterica serovar Pullorum]
MAFERAPFGDLDIDPFTLYGIGIFNSDVGIIQRHCANLFTLFFSLIKSLGDQGMGLFIEHSVSCYVIRCCCAGWRRGCVLPGLRFGIASCIVFL